MGIKLENNNKPMPTQEIGLYRMAKQAKANKMMHKAASIANAITLSQMPAMVFGKKKK
jgi:hypothetical protein